MPVRSADARSISTDQELWDGKGKGPGLSDQEDAKGEVKEHLAYLQGYLKVSALPTIRSTRLAVAIEPESSISRTWLNNSAYGCP